MARELKLGASQEADMRKFQTKEEVGALLWASTACQLTWTVFAKGAVR